MFIRYVMFIIIMVWWQPLFAYDISEDFSVHYRYGMPDWDSKLNQAEIYPRVWPTIVDYYDYYDDLSAYAVLQYYTISKKESDYEQENNKIYLHLAVRQQKSIVKATTTISNKSHRSFYVHRLTLPLSANGGPYHSLCSGIFIPKTNDIQLDFFKKTKCRFGDWVDKFVWHEVLPGTSFSFETAMNYYYAFLPGIHRYDIGTVVFTIVNNEWFTEQRSYKYLLAIMNWRAERVCLHPIDKITYGIAAWQVKNSCGVYYGNGLFQDFLERFNYHGGNKNIFKIRSNQVNVTIDGDITDTPCSLRGY